ncbi:MAG: HesA/MoeB/ThiF family protein [Flavipsychrobacter sp.]
MSDWMRYSCQIALPGFDDEAQQKLSQAKVLIVGMGGLGCPVAQYLVSSGIGTIGFADYDVVSIKNLHRQILYTPADEGEKKIVAASKWLRSQNPDIVINEHDLTVSPENVVSLIALYDIVVDCTDNFETRYLLNDACVLVEKPLVYGAIYQYEGQVAVWNTKNQDGGRSPNYRDLYPNVNAAAVPNCADGGVIPTIAGIIGCMQANEVIKLITKTGNVLAGKVLVFDAQTMNSRVIKMGSQTKTNITTLPKQASVLEIVRNDLEKLDGYLLIDVRTTEERFAFNIGGMHLPLQEIDRHIGSFNHKTLVFYCASGKRSKQAAQIAKKHHPDLLVYSLTDGTNDWQH